MLKLAVRSKNFEILEKCRVFEKNSNFHEISNLCIFASFWATPTIKQLKIISIIWISIGERHMGVCAVARAETAPPSASYSKNCFKKHFLYDTCLGRQCAQKRASVLLMIRNENWWCFGYSLLALSLVQLNILRKTKNVELAAKSKQLIFLEKEKSNFQ